MDKISCVSRYLDIKIHILSLLTESFCESRTSAPIGKTRTESCEISPSSFNSRAPDLVRLLPKSNCRLSSRFNYFARNNTKASRFFNLHQICEISRFQCPNNNLQLYYILDFSNSSRRRRSTKSRKRKDKKEVATRSNCVIVVTVIV